MEFADVVAEHGHALVRTAYLLCHDASRAEDLAQEALMKAHTRWQRHGPPEHPGAYLRRIVVTEYLGWRRRRASTELVGVDLDDVPAAPDATTGVDERDAAWRAMATLPARQRAVLVLRYYEGLPDREIATLVGVSEATVRSLASRAFATLRDHPSLANSVSSRVVTPQEYTESGRGGGSA
ncbi:SigE family RNA polymerase sigma factor [Jatrophihabitans sp. YIM 134969]